MASSAVYWSEIETSPVMPSPNPVTCPGGYRMVRHAPHLLALRAMRPSCIQQVHDGPTHNCVQVPGNASEKADAGFHL